MKTVAADANGKIRAALRVCKLAFEIIERRLRESLRRIREGDGTSDGGGGDSGSSGSNSARPAVRASDLLTVEIVKEAMAIEGVKQEQYHAGAGARAGAGGCG